MVRPNDGGPAFPTSPKDSDHGMTLRDYFADSAMREMLARIKYSPDRYAAVAHESYQMADAMLEARERDPKA